MDIHTHTQIHRHAHRHTHRRFNVGTWKRNVKPSIKRIYVQVRRTTGIFRFRFANGNFVLFIQWMVHCIVRSNNPIVSFFFLLFFLQPPPLPSWSPKFLFLFFLLQFLNVLTTLLISSSPLPPFFRYKKKKEKFLSLSFIFHSKEWNFSPLLFNISSTIMIQPSNERLLHSRTRILIP